MRRLEGIFSLYREDSALSRLNRQGYLDDPPADLLQLLSVSLRYGRLTGGAFDPTVQPLWQLYAGHFSQPGADPAGPSAQAVARALDRVSREDVALDSGRIALERGCVDLVLAGHLHLQVGPERVEGANGRVGYRYTTGTTGGAAYAVAIGSKLRRDAQVSFVTYAEGRPIGIQSVTVRTNGELRVAPWVPLELDDPDEQPDQP